MFRGRGGATPPYEEGFRPERPRPPGVRVYPGDRLEFTYFASAAPTSIFPSATIEYDTFIGSPIEKDVLAVSVTSFTTDRTVVSAQSSRINRAGTITRAAIDGDAGTLKRGQFYSALYLDPLIGPNSGLIGDYFYAGNVMTPWKIVPSGPGGGEGFIRTVTGTNPAAGAEVSEAVPTNAIWNLLAFGVVLVTDGNAANRTSNLIIDDGTTQNRRWALRDSTAQTATQTRTHLWTRGYSQAAVLGSDQFDDTDNLLVIQALPEPLILPEGYRIRTITGGLLAGDNYAAPIFQVGEWLVV